METAIATAPLLPIPITQLEKIQTDIAILKEKDAAVSFDYRDPKQNKLARSHVFSLRQINGTIDKAHASAKAGVLEIGKKLDAKKAELRAEVAALIDPHQKELDQIEEEEAERIAKHRAVIAHIGLGRGWGPQHTPTAIRQAMDEFTAMDLADLQEFREQAERERSATLAHLVNVHIAATKREADAAELQKLREDAERAKAERLQREAAEAERQRNEEAERKRIAKESAAQARKDAQAAAEKERLAREAQEKIHEAERREAEAMLAVERAARGKSEAEKRALEAEAQRKADAERAKEEAEIARKRAEWDRAEAAKKAQAERDALQARINADLARREQEAQADKEREEARKHAEQENRSAIIRGIADWLLALSHLSALEIAEIIANDKMPHVRIDWEKP